MAKILVAGTEYEIPDQVPNKPRRLIKQPHTETGLSLFQFLVELFEENEKRPKKLTDSQLEATVKTAFADSSKVLDSIANSRGSRICKWRWLYNTGRMTGDEAPSICSFRYNEKGEPVDGKVKLSPLTRENQIATAKKYGIHDQRFVAKRKDK